MSTNDTGQGQKDAAERKAAREMQNEHWKARQDYNAGYVAEKNKPR